MARPETLRSHALPSVASAMFCVVPMQSNSTDAAVVSDAVGRSGTIKNKGGAPSSFIWKFFTRLEQSNKKTNRYRAQCNSCQHVVEDGRVENLHKHILHVCQAATADVKHYVEAELDKKAQEKGQSGKKVIKRSHLQTPRTARLSAAMSVEEQEALDVKLFRMIIMNDMPFTVVDNPWLLDLCQGLSPFYVPAGKLLPAGVPGCSDASAAQQEPCSVSVVSAICCLQVQQSCKQKC